MCFIFQKNHNGSISINLINKQRMENKTPRPPKPIRLTTDQIKATNAFQSATKMIQLMTVKRTNFLCIEHGVNVASNIGFDQWNQQTQSTFTNREIVREIIESK